MHHGTALALSALLAVGSAGAAPADEKTFIGGKSLDWLAPANWEPAGVPGPDDDAILAGARTVELDDSAMVLNFTLRSGELAGTGTLTIGDRLEWISGNMRGAFLGGLGITIVERRIDLPLGGPKNLNDRILFLQGETATLAGGDNTISFGNATLINRGRFEAVNDDVNAVHGFFGSGAFNNMGTLQKTGAGRTRFQGVELNNGGAVDVLAGVLELSTGSANGVSTFRVDAGAEIRFDGFQFGLLPGSIVTGAGKVVFNGTADLESAYDVATTEIVGTVNLLVPVTIANLVLAGGQISGDPDLTVTDSMAWSGGGMSGAGVTNLENGASLSGGTKDVVDRTINFNGGTATMTGFNSRFELANATLNNHAVFEITAAGGAGNNRFRGGGSFNNAGEPRVSTQVVFDGVRFENAGTVEISAPMQANGGYRQSGGVTRLLDGGLLASSGAPFEIEAGTLEGSGQIQGTVGNAGRLGPGLSAGRLEIVGSYTQTATGTFAVEIGGREPGEFDVLNVAGQANLAGALDVSLVDGFVPAPGDAFAVMTFAAGSGGFDSAHGLVVGDGLGFAVRLNDRDVTLEIVVEDCANGADDDQDGATDCDDAKCDGAPSCDDATPTLATPTPTLDPSPPPTTTPTPPDTPTPTATPTGAACPGDCNEDGAITVNEPVRLVDLSMSEASAAACRAGDRDGDDRIDVYEVILAVANALRGCR